MSEELLKIDHLSISLPTDSDRLMAVDDVSLVIKSGEIVCVVGESGSGKSTLSHAILRLLPKELTISQGQIIFKGNDLSKIKNKEMNAIRGKKISMIFQEPLSALNPLIKCGAQIREALDTHGVNKTEQHKHIREILIAVGLIDCDRIIESYPFQLSGGQRQRVMIAMALILEPELLIADEPTTALDVTTQAQILAVLKEIQQRKKIGVLFITHDFGVVAEIADHIVVMKDGKIVEQGSKEEILLHPQQDYTKHLISAVPSTVPPSTHAIFDEVFNRNSIFLRVQGLGKTYVRKPSLFKPEQSFLAVDEVDFHIAKGETVGLVGESGSGKSTIGRMLTGLVKADRGRAFWHGKDITAPGAFDDPSIRQAIQMIFQDPYSSLNPRQRISKILTSGMINRGIKREAAYQRAEELLDLVKLDKNSMHRYPHEFSGGQRQRLGFARAIAANPELIVADEPVSALDVSVQEQVLDLLISLKKKLGLSMLFITHDLRVAAQLCDRIIVLQKGIIVEQGSAEEILLHSKHPYTQKLVKAIPGKNWK